MKKKQNNNICYVFSQTTLDLALNEWIEVEISSNPKKREEYLIVAATVPWFLKHLNQSASIYMFTHIDLIEELKIWQSAQESEYPHQKDRIEKTCIGIVNFFESEIVSEHKMLVQS